MFDRLLMLAAAISGSDTFRRAEACAPKAQQLFRRLIDADRKADDI